MIAIDLFAGAGGMSCGAEAAGIKVAMSVESDVHAARTYALNHPSTIVLPKKVELVTRADLTAVKRGKQGTVLFGGPPCQGFSYSNQRTRRIDNPNNWLFTEFLRVVNI